MTTDNSTTRTRFGVVPPAYMLDSVRSISRSLYILGCDMESWNAADVGVKPGDQLYDAAMEMLAEVECLKEDLAAMYPERVDENGNLIDAPT